MIDQQKLVELLTAFPEKREELRKELEVFSRLRQRRIFLLSLLFAILGGLSVILVFLLMERTPFQAESLRYFSAGTFYLLLIVSFIAGVRTLLSFPPRVTVAKEIEKYVPELKSGLISAAEFDTDNFPDGASTALAKLTVGTVLTGFSREKIKVALTPYSPKKYISAILGLTMILLAWGLLSPLEVNRGIRRLINPFSKLLSYSPLELIVQPGDKIVPKGENLQISATPNQDVQGEPILTLFKPDKTEGTATEMYPDQTASRAKFVFTLTGLQESTDYQVTMDKFSSQRFSISVLPRPEIKNLELTVHYPDYLEIAPKKLNNNSGDCSIPEGSKLALLVQASQKIASAGIVFTPLATHTLEFKGSILNSDFSLATSTRYSILIENEQGLVNENPIQYQILVTPDAAPTVAILKPAADLPLPTSRRLDLKVASQDDFGVVSMVLYYSIGTRDNWIPLNMKADFSPKKEFEVDYPWLLDTVPVQPGTEIQYFVKVEDNFRPVAHVATSPTFSVSMPSMYDVYRGSENAHQEIEEKLKEYMDRQKLRQEALNKAMEEIRHEKRLDYEVEKQLEKSLQEGMEEQKKGEEILEQFQNYRDKIEENPFSSPESLEKMQKVSELLNQVLDDEAKKLMKQLQETMKDMKLDPEDMQKFEQAFKMDEFLKSLDRSIKLLEKVKEDMKMNSLGNALEDLLKRQEAIASETRELEKRMESGALPPLEELRSKDLQKQKEEMDAHFQNKLKEIASQIDELQKKNQDQEQQEALKKQIEALKEENKQQQTKLDSEMKKLQEKPGELSEEEKARLKELEEKSKELTEKLQEKLNELSRKMAKMEEDRKNALSPEDQKQLEKLKEQEKALNEEFKKQAEKLAAEMEKFEEKRKKGALSREDEARLQDLKAQQEKVKTELEKLQKQAEEMASRKQPPGEPPDPRQEDLKNLRDNMKKEDFSREMDKVQKDLSDKNFQQAQKGQQRMLKFLESLAKDGKKMCSSPGGGGQMKQLDLSRFIRKALSVSRDQEELLESIDGLPGKFMRGHMPTIEGRIDETSVMQLLVKKQALDLENALETYVRASFSVNPEIMTPLMGVQQIFSQIVKDLEDRSIDESRMNQREIIRRFNRLAIELMKAQDKMPDASNSQDPMNALQQFKDLTRRQLSLYQKMEQQKLSPVNQQLMQQLRQMAMEQRKVRESLEKLMRDGKSHKDLRGRLDDIMKEMNDLETKILDPNLRREVSERQKAIYDRMLRAQKSIRNRDEENEERKAEAAREIFQPEPDKPLPEVGSESRDLSRDYLSEIREDYPKSYEKEIQDYYRSLNLMGDSEY